MECKPFLQNLWRWKCGLPERHITIEKINLEELRESEWSKEFETLMRNRLLMGAFRYGKISGKNKPRYDYIGDIIKRAQLYKETGNKEYLVDVANLALVEFVQGGNHPNPHFAPSDDGHHTPTK